MRSISSLMQKGSSLSGRTNWRKSIPYSRWNANASAPWRKWIAPSSAWNPVRMQGATHIIFEVCTTFAVLSNLRFCIVSSGFHMIVLLYRRSIRCWNLYFPKLQWNRNVANNAAQCFRLFHHTGRCDYSQSYCQHCCRLLSTCMDHLSPILSSPHPSGLVAGLRWQVAVLRPAWCPEYPARRCQETKCTKSALGTSRPERMCARRRV